MLIAMSAIAIFSTAFYNFINQPGGAGRILARNSSNLHKSKNSMIGKFTRLALLIGIICFGFIFPDSLSDHTKLLHFAAHMGMSFFVAICSYVVADVMLHMKRAASLTLLVIVTLVVGVIYKYFEISSLGLIETYSFWPLLKATGCYTSMSQNTAGLLAAILLIELIFSRVRSLHHALVPGSLLSAAEVLSHPVRPRTSIPRA